MNNIIYIEALDKHINYLKKLQKEHNLFLDLEENKVRHNYCWTYCSDNSFVNFIYMLCDMTSENNLNNEIVVKEIQKSINLNEIYRKGTLQYEEFLGAMAMLRILQIEHKLFLDLEDGDVIKKYCETYPGCSDDFLFMICAMTKDKNILQNKVFIKYLSEEPKPKAYRKSLHGLGTKKKLTALKKI